MVGCRDAVTNVEDKMPVDDMIKDSVPETVALSLSLNSQLQIQLVRTIRIKIYQPGSGKRWIWV